MLHHAGILKIQTSLSLSLIFFISLAEICGISRWSSRRRAATDGSVSSATRCSRFARSSLAVFSPKTSENSFRPSTLRGNSIPRRHRFRSRRPRIKKSQLRNHPNQEREVIGLSIWNPPKKRKEEEKVLADFGARNFWFLVNFNCWVFMGFAWISLSGSVLESEVEIVTEFPREMFEKRRREGRKQLLKPLFSKRKEPPGNPQGNLFSCLLYS